MEELHVFDPAPDPPEVVVVGRTPPGSPTRIRTGAVVVVVPLEELHCVPVEVLPEPFLLLCWVLWFFEPVRVAECEEPWVPDEFELVLEPPEALVRGAGFEVPVEPPEVVSGLGPSVEIDEAALW